MPMILTEPEEVQTRLTAELEEAEALQRSLPDDALVEVGRGVKQGGDALHADAMQSGAVKRNP